MDWLLEPKVVERFHIKKLEDNEDDEVLIFSVGDILYCTAYLELQDAIGVNPNRRKLLTKEYIKNNITEAMKRDIAEDFIEGTTHSLEYYFMEHFDGISVTKDNSIYLYI